MLWHETNFTGGYSEVQGKVVRRTHRERLPVALRRVPRMFLDFGHAKSREQTKLKRIPFTEAHFDKEKPHDIIWDLYFDKIQLDCDARLVLVPRGVFDWYQPIYPEAVDCLGWQYVGQLESSTFRWDLHIILCDFFGTSINIPHCKIEAFLPSLTIPDGPDHPKPPQEGATGTQYQTKRRGKPKPTEIICAADKYCYLPEKMRTSSRNRRSGKNRKKFVLADSSNEVHV